MSNYLSLWNDHIESLKALQWNLDDKKDLDKIANIEITLKALAKKADKNRQAREKIELEKIEKRLKK